MLYSTSSWMFIFNVIHPYSCDFPHLLLARWTFFQMSPKKKILPSKSPVSYSEHTWRNAVLAKSYVTGEQPLEHWNNDIPAETLKNGDFYCIQLKMITWLTEKIANASFSFYCVWLMTHIESHRVTSFLIPPPPYRLKPYSTFTSRSSSPRISAMRPRQWKVTSCLLLLSWDVPCAKESIQESRQW